MKKKRQSNHNADDCLHFLTCTVDAVGTGSRGIRDSSVSALLSDGPFLFIEWAITGVRNKRERGERGGGGGRKRRRNKRGGGGEEKEQEEKGRRKRKIGRRRRRGGRGGEVEEEEEDEGRSV